MNNKDLKEEVLLYSNSNPKKCMRCGKCSGTCPAYNEMEYHPHQFVYMVENGDIEPLLKSPSIYKCLTCFACVDRCPRNVEPAMIIESIRLLATRDKNGDHFAPEDLEKYLDDELPQQAIVSAFRKYKK